MMQKADIIHSLKELESENEIEILECSRSSITIYDYQDGKEITYTFRRSKTSLAQHIHISKKIPQKYRPNKEKLIQYLLALPEDVLLTLNEVWLLWNFDDYEDMVDYHDVDSAWATDLYDENVLGKMWFDQNTAIIDVQNIVKSALEIEEQDIAMGLYGYADTDIKEQTVLTIVHEIRHIMMDTNLILPEDDYPIHLASETEVEDFARMWVSDHGWNIF